MGYFPPPPTTRDQVYGDMLYCFQYFDFAFQSPHFLDFGKGGFEVSRIPSRGKPTFFIRFGPEDSTMEYMLAKYILVFREQTSLPPRYWTKSYR